MLETSALAKSLQWPIYIINSVDKTKLPFSQDGFSHYEHHSSLKFIRIHVSMATYIQLLQ